MAGFCSATLAGNYSGVDNTCHAGSNYNDLMAFHAQRERFTAYAATKSDKPAMEDARLGHGYFTYEIVRGLRGEASADASGEVHTLGLANYVRDRVQQLSGGAQEPDYVPGPENFVLVRR